MRRMEFGSLFLSCEKSLISVVATASCQKLKPLIAESNSVEELSKNFIMVHCEDEEEPSHPSFKPVTWLDVWTGSRFGFARVSPDQWSANTAVWLILYELLCCATCV